MSTDWGAALSAFDVLRNQFHSLQQLEAKLDSLVPVLARVEHLETTVNELRETVSSLESRLSRREAVASQHHGLIHKMREQMTMLNDGLDQLSGIHDAASRIDTVDYTREVEMEDVRSTISEDEVLSQLDPDLDPHNHPTVDSTRPSPSPDRSNDYISNNPASTQSFNPVSSPPPQTSTFATTFPQLHVSPISARTSSSDQAALLRLRQDLGMADASSSQEPLYPVVTPSRNLAQPVNHGAQLFAQIPVYKTPAKAQSSRKRRGLNESPDSASRSPRANDSSDYSTASEGRHIPARPITPPSPASPAMFASRFRPASSSLRALPKVLPHPQPPTSPSKSTASLASTVPVPGSYPKEPRMSFGGRTIKATPLLTPPQSQESSSASLLADKGKGRDPQMHYPSPEPFSPPKPSSSVSQSTSTFSPSSRIINGPSSASSSKDITLTTRQGAIHNTLKGNSVDGTYLTELAGILDMGDDLAAFGHLSNDVFAMVASGVVRIMPTEDNNDEDDWLLQLVPNPPGRVVFSID
ncbi:hypothetical protein DL93DRAFT_2224564 [Clavulina sp. PMI_390]|nr:hypothetical protein DL93DRAFT_2224564 [Clavulina sp. PMI_390]